jgi:RecA/RadA recombinase
MNSPLASAARLYQAAGLAVLPAHLAEKRPALPSWKTYQRRLPTSIDVRSWFSNKHSACCIVTGTVSGNLELLDFDCAGEAFPAWRALVTQRDHSLFQRLVIERSPSGGYHVLYRCDDTVPGNKKLAQRKEYCDGPEPLERFGKQAIPRQDADGRWHLTHTLIETRGEGGLFLCAPTEGYKLIQGQLEAVARLTKEERQLLIACADSLDDMPKKPAPSSKPLPPTSPRLSISDTSRPGDAFTDSCDLSALLMHHGWSLTRDGDNQHWCRPGKTGATSATLRDGSFYVFSSNASPFASETSYNAFAVYTLLEHHGDFQAASAALRGLGFGEQLPTEDPDVDLSGILANKNNPADLFDLRTISEVQENEVDWLWPGVIPRGMLSLIGGKQGLGKSFLICDLAARISAGKPMPDGSQGDPAKVLLLAREDDHGCVLKPRLRAAGADTDNVLVSLFSSTAHKTPIDLATNIEVLIEATLKHRFEMIVVDTFAAFASVGTDANAAQDVRQLLDSLTRLAQTTQAAVVVIAHLRKSGQADGDPMDAIAGSAQMTAGVRVASLLEKGYTDGERRFRVVKSNLGQVNDTGWTWRFGYADPFVEGAGQMPHLVWAKAGKHNPEELAENNQTEFNERLVEQYLFEVLEDGPMSRRLACDEIYKELRRAKISARKLDIEIAIEDLIDSKHSSIAGWIGQRHAKMVGLSGSEPKEEDSPQHRALLAAKADPTLTVRALRELVGCRREIALEALQIAQGKVKKSPQE